jgi:O-antigen biosynthesis protein
VYDEPVLSGAMEELRAIAGDRLIAIRYDKPFNFSEKCNLGFLHAHGDVVVLVNDDVQPRSERWLESLVAPLSEPGVGLTGAKLLYEDGSIQHGGHLHARDAKVPRPKLAYRYAPGDTVGPFNSLVVNRETSGVTGACLAVTRETFERIGGLTEGLPANFNDVDLSLKVQHIGLRVLWLAEPVLFHFESQSREPVVQPFERDYIYKRWGGFVRDPYLPWLTS